MRDALGRRDDLDWKPPYRRVTMRAGRARRHPTDDPRGAVTAEELADASGLLAAAAALRRGEAGALRAGEGQAPGRALRGGRRSRGSSQPTFLYEFPTEISPLSKQDRATRSGRTGSSSTPRGMEIANGFSELNDPAEQEARFRRQAEDRAKGDLEAAAVRRGLRRGARVRHAADRGRRPRDRPPDDAPDEPALDPRRHPVSAPEAQVMSRKT